MYHFKLSLLCLLFSPVFIYGNDSTSVKATSSYRNTVLLCFNYGRQVPVGILSKRFGASNSLGFSVAYKFGHNWQVQGSINTLFSGKVKENGILDSIANDQGFLIDNTGTQAEVRMYERGYHWHVDIGKIIRFGSFSKNSGLLISGGVGFIQHKIKFTFQRSVLPQLENNYYKGYDRLSNGLMVRGFAGYQHIDPKGMFSYIAGFEVLNGFTRNRRSYNYDTRIADTMRRNDLLIGIKVGIMISLTGRKAGLKKGDEERYFE